jgi:hypothetical protein
MSFKNLTCILALFLLTAGVAFAGPGEHLVKQRIVPASFSSLPQEQAEAASGLVAAHHQRVRALANRGELTRERFDAIFAEMLNDLEPLLAGGTSTEKSASDCTTACSLAQAAETDICDAADQAAIALAACPSSTYASDADYYADTECNASPNTVYYSCLGPSGKTEALARLATAKSRSSSAWNNAWYAYSTDGCSESYQTALDASDAYVNFHNARYSMLSCS